MKIPDAFLFEVETKVNADASDGEKVKLDISISEARSVVFCKNCKHYRRIIKFPTICPKDAVGTVSIICDKWHGETGPCGFCHHGKEKTHD